MLSCAAACTDEPMTGTASGAGFYLVLEQPGPWGKKALTQSRLDPELGAALERACKGAGGKILLMRAVGQHVAASDHPRTVLLAGGPPERPWLLRGTVTDPAVLLDLPLADLTGEPPAVDWLLPSGPVALVCTNAKRDQCCALLGRPLAGEASRRHPGQVWECSHTGGHRFAPTGIVLPTAQMLGRLSADVLGAALDGAARGEVLVDPAHDRGRGHHHDTMLAAAESYVRAELGAPGLADVAVRTDADGVLADVRGTTYRAELEQVPQPALPASCGAEPKQRLAWRGVTLAPLR